ncbi:MAG: YdeI/OmpD-associated family protein [Anaeromyxobacteraceae bacterium]
MADPGPLLVCETPAAWERWLSKHHATSPDGVWLEFAKKGVPLRRVTYLEAVEVALCWGWIDARSQGLDARTWKQRFVPRRPKSTWSKVNREKVAALIAAGRMSPPGLAEVERAKADGRWDAAYDSPKNATVPPDLAKALSRAPRAKALFGKLDGANRYAILHRLMLTKKPELRARKVERFVDELARGVVPHPDRLPKAVRGVGAKRKAAAAAAKPKAKAKARAKAKAKVARGNAEKDQVAATSAASLEPGAHSVKGDVPRARSPRA